MASSALLRHEGVSRSQVARAVRSGLIVRVRPHVYALTPLPPPPRWVVTGEGVDPAYVASVRAALLSLGGAASASGRTAAALYGWGMAIEPRRTLEVAVPHGRSATRRADVSVVQRRSATRGQFVVLPGTAPLWVTTPVQTVLDCASALPLLEAVVLCDSALRARAVSARELVWAATRRPGGHGASSLRRAVALSDPSSGSVLESILRVRMHLAGITGFATQLLVRDQPGRHLRVDFAFLAEGLVLEVDGARWHQNPARDQARDNALAALGWRVLRFTWSQVVGAPADVIAEIQAALGCATPGLHLSRRLLAAAA